MEQYFNQYICSTIENLKQNISRDFNKDVTDYIVNTAYNFSLIAKDELIKKREFNEYAITNIINFICDWIYKIGMSLINEKIDRQYTDEILQKIAFVIYEITTDDRFKEFALPQQKEIINHHVRKYFKSNIAELYAKGIFSKKTKDNLLFRADIDYEFAQNTITENIDKEMDIENDTLSEENNIENLTENFSLPQKIIFTLIIICLSLHIIKVFLQIILNI